MHSRETVSVAQSTFMIDCHQLAVMLRHATDRSLLLIDEFGKGTNYQGILLVLSSCSALGVQVMKKFFSRLMIGCWPLHSVDGWLPECLKLKWILMDQASFTLHHLQFIPSASSLTLFFFFFCLLSLARWSVAVGCHDSLSPVQRV
jgi:hypothetical protein